MGFRDLKLRVRALIIPRGVEQDLHDELSFHVERETRKLIDRGLQPDQARARAQARFGSATVVADECRDARGTAFVDNTIREVRFALPLVHAGAADRLHDRHDRRVRRTLRQE